MSSPPRTRRRRPLEEPAVIARRSPFLFRLFGRYIRRYLAKHMHAIRVSRAGGMPSLPEGPVLVVLNHPSWWDPLLCLLLAGHYQDRSHYGPIDAVSLNKYRFFERLGFFGIEPGTARGGATFLRTSLAIMARPESMLWVTAQGRFTDARQRPAGLRPGVGHLACRLERGIVLPLALEYPFWQERTAECLLRFGTPLAIDKGQSLTADEWTAAMERALEATQDALAAEALRRDEHDFTLLLGGRAGVGGVYDWWRGLRARMRGQRFRPEHGAEEPS